MYTQILTQAFKDQFQNLKIDMFPALGNHDVWPSNN